jgi:predicted DNA-binding transcriptional regulator AlpA
VKDSEKVREVCSSTDSGIRNAEVVEAGSDLERGDARDTKDAGADQGAASTEEGVFLTKLAGLPEGTLLNATALAECLSVSTRTLQRMVKHGQVPDGVKLGGRRVWMAGKVRGFLGDRSDRMAQAARKLSLRFSGEA